MGLYRYSITKIKGIKAELSSIDEKQLEVIKNLLKADKEANSEILKAINHLDPHLFNIKMNHRRERQQRYISILQKEE